MKMNNHIRQLKVHNGQLIPARAEVWITVDPEYQTPTTEVRGRLMGPRCPYASTVEVAYPLRVPPPHHVPAGSSPLTMQVVIPEASLWEPESPFLYQGPIELWQDGRCCHRATLSHGLRYFLLGDSGLRVNSRPLTLRGRMVADCPDEEALALHRSGYNLLVVPVQAGTLAVWERADRFGFFVLGQVKNDSEQTVRMLEILSRHTSCLGWLIDDQTHPPLDLLPAETLVGLVCASGIPKVLPPCVHFLAGSLELTNLGHPLLVIGEVSGPLPEGSVILGNVI
jgi:hypothetical protein